MYHMLSNYVFMKTISLSLGFVMITGLIFGSFSLLPFSISERQVTILFNAKTQASATIFKTASEIKDFYYIKAN